MADHRHGAVRHRTTHANRIAAIRIATARTPAVPRMALGQRATIFMVLGALWASGCLWLILDTFFARPGQFGTTPHPWQSTLLLLHGIIALLSMYLLGWVTARHVLRWWPGRLRRWSGGTLTAFLVLLVVSGFTLFFLSDDRWQHAAALTHDVLGLGVTLFGVQHWFFARRRDIRNAASRP